MKLKHVLFSGLLLSVGLTACTNDDFTEVTAPVNTSEAIALGDDFTINVNNGSADTKAAFGDDFAPAWKEGDKIGAAWVHMVTKFNEETNEVENDGISSIGGSYGGFYSNSPLQLFEGAETNNGKFKTVDDANLFAGAYVLYSPYNPNISMQYKELPVELKSYTFDADEPLKNISDNMFSYSPVKFVPGGNQSGTFTLHQVPVLVRLSFTAADELNFALEEGGLTVKNIVLEAYSSADQPVLVQEGKIVTTTDAPTVPQYNSEEASALDGIVKYEYAKTTDHLFITTNGTDNSDYKLLKKEVPTVKEFTFSILPLAQKAAHFTVKIVTDKGTFKKDYNDYSVDKAQIDMFNRAAMAPDAKDATGAYLDAERQVRINVILDVTDADDVIYTADEFMKRWEEAVAAGKHVDLQVGTDLTLPGGLTANNKDVDITVTGHQLTMPTLDIEKNKGITFNCPVVVESDVMTSGASDVTFNDLTAENVEIQGKGIISANSIEKLIVASSGVVTLNAAADAEEAKVGDIEIQTGTTGKGTLTLNSTDLTIDRLDNAGAITLSTDMTNTADMTLTIAKGATLSIGTHTFTNEGKVEVNGAISTGTGRFKNMPGATLDIKANNSFNLTNSAVDEVKYAGKPAAVVNIAAGVTLTANTGKAVENGGIINVTGNLNEAADGTLTQTDEAARINAKAENANITLQKTEDTDGGYVVILNDNNLTVSDKSKSRIAYELVDAAATAPTKADIVFVNTSITSTKLNGLSGYQLFVNSDITFDSTTTSVTLSRNFVVTGTVNIRLATGVIRGELTLQGSGHGVAGTGNLKLSEGVTINVLASGWSMNGIFAPNGGKLNLQ